MLNWVINCNDILLILDKVLSVKKEENEGNQKIFLFLI